MTAHVYHQIKRFLKDSFFMNPEYINPHKSFVNDLGLSTLEFWEVIAVLENTYHITLPDHQLSPGLTVKEVCRLVEYQLVHNHELVLV
ncbi:MAG: acyl carrier protein [Spirosomataceae bacterium]